MRPNRDPASTQAAPPAIVLGVEHPRAVAVIQSLGRMGVPVVGVDHLSTAYGMCSRYVREKIFVDGDYGSALAMLDSLDRYRGAVLIPTNDHYLTFVSQHFEHLSDRFIVTTPPWNVVSTLMDKSRCYALAHSVGLVTPPCFTPSTLDDLERVIAQLDFANHGYVLTKTLPIAEPTDGVTGRYTRVAGPDPQTLRARCREILQRTGELPMIAQVVPGQADSCIGVSMVLDRTFAPVACYCVKRLQLRPYTTGEGFVHPYELGANVYCESRHDNEAVEAAHRLLRAAGYYGMATVEFRRDAVDGILKLIKVDPRVVRATGLSRALGIDIPKVLFGVFTGAPVSAPVPYADGVAWIWLTSYLDTVWAQGSRVFVRRLGLLLREAGHLRAAAFLSSADPKPFLAELGRWAWALIVNESYRIRRKVAELVKPSRRGSLDRSPR